MKRDWNANHSRTKFRPEEILIAGLDYETADDDPLRDEPSEGRRAKDPELLERFRKLEHAYRGGLFKGTIFVTARVVGGKKCPVAINGRRRVLMSRAYNAEREARGLEPLVWAVEYQQAGDEAFEIARLLNQGSAPETHAQKARYFERLVSRGYEKTAAAELLELPASAVPHLEAVASSQCAPWVFQALDRGEIGLQAAAMVAARTPEEQARVLQELGGRRPTTSLIRKLVAEGKGTRATVAPDMKRIRALVQKKPVDAHEAAFMRGVQFARGLIAAKDVPELEGIWEDES